MMGYNWYETEQLNEVIKNRVIDVLSKYDNQVNIILFHTCPFKYVPYEAFISGIDQSKVDNSIERFLDEIESNTRYDLWYCEHYHIDKKIDKICFMMNDIMELR